MYLIINPIVTPRKSSRDGTCYKLTAHKIFKRRKRGEGRSECMKINGLHSGQMNWNFSSAP